MWFGRRRTSPPKCCQCIDVTRRVQRTPPPPTTTTWHASRTRRNNQCEICPSKIQSLANHVAVHKNPVQRRRLEISYTTVYKPSSRVSVAYLPVKFNGRHGTFSLCARTYCAAVFLPGKSNGGVVEMMVMQHQKDLCLQTIFIFCCHPVHFN